ncbi:MAG TPA: hypothetical protein VFH27_10815 [Longimicrobiaceae bacterium]|nr:hypothetical protein [Longimicrobiaceae bacterium]
MNPGSRGEVEQMDETGGPREGKKQFLIAFGVAFVIAFVWMIGFPLLLRGIKALAATIGSQP